jgi:hypothetical protein
MTLARQPHDLVDARGLRAPSSVAAVHVVERPPSWRERPTRLTYIFLEEEPSGADLARACQWALDAGLENPRVIPPMLLAWSSLFNPRFFLACEGRVERRCRALASTGGLRIGDVQRLTRFWLESVLFLASVTLSAAIVQSRCSTGTIESKYDRLWQAGCVARDAELSELLSLDLTAEVASLARTKTLPDIERLLQVRRLFESAIVALGRDVPVQHGMMRETAIPEQFEGRFGFVRDLRDLLGPELVAVVVYGSSISSDDFADYDVLLVSDHAERTLRRLAATSPSWGGKELNVGVYSPSELWAMQLLSGDNLDEYGLCIHGAVDLPRKEVGHLLARNVSFGMVRQRQQLGMVSAALVEAAGTDGDGRRNLYEYFAKIPANIAKGTFGATGRKLPKQAVHEWLQDRCGFDAPGAQARAVTGPPGPALADAAVATSAVLQALNDELGLVTTAGCQPARLEVQGR